MKDPHADGCAAAAADNATPRYFLKTITRQRYSDEPPIEERQIRTLHPPFEGNWAPSFTDPTNPNAGWIVATLKHCSAKEAQAMLDALNGVAR